MVDDHDSAQLSDYCFNVCEVLKTTVQGRGVDSLSEPARAALGDLERCVDWPCSVCSLTEQLQGDARNRTDSQEGGDYAT